MLSERKYRLLDLHRRSILNHTGFDSSFGCSLFFCFVRLVFLVVCKNISFMIGGLGQSPGKPHDHWQDRWLVSVMVGVGQKLFSATHSLAKFRYQFFVKDFALW